MKCVLCGIEARQWDSDYCSLECARWDRLCARIKRVEDVLVEVKYAVLRLEK